MLRVSVPPPPSRRPQSSPVAAEMPFASPHRVAAVSVHDAIVVGAGPAGLSVAATLGARGVETVVIERADEVGASWRGHYDRLHLHTVRWLSHLPGLRFAHEHGPWVSRDGVVSYLEHYVRHHDLDVRSGVTAERIEPEGDGWAVDTDQGRFQRRSWSSPRGSTATRSCPIGLGATGSPASCCTPVTTGTRSPIETRTCWWSGPGTPARRSPSTSWKAAPAGCGSRSVPRPRSCGATCSASRASSRACWSAGCRRCCSIR